MTNLENEILEALAHFQLDRTYDGHSEISYGDKICDLAKFIAKHISKKKREGL